MGVRSGVGEFSVIHRVLCLHSAGTGRSTPRPSWGQFGGYVTSMATVVSAMPFKPRRSGSWFSLQGRSIPQSEQVLTHFYSLLSCFHTAVSWPGRKPTHTLQTLFGSKYWRSTSALIQQCSPFCKSIALSCPFPA